MFSNFAWSEMLVIACVAIIVVGPKDLPGMLRQFGKTLGSIKRMAGDFQRQFNDALKEAELDEVKDLTSGKSFAPLEDAKKSMEDFTKSIKDKVDVSDEVEATASPKPIKDAAPEVQPAEKSTAAANGANGKTPAKKKTAPKKSVAAKSLSKSEKPTSQETAS